LRQREAQFLFHEHAFIEPQQPDKGDKTRQKSFAFVQENVIVISGGLAVEAPLHASLHRSVRIVSYTRKCYPEKASLSAIVQHLAEIGTTAK
jgi:hypothetical protein